MMTEADAVFSIISDILSKFCVWSMIKLIWPSGEMTNKNPNQ